MAASTRIETPFAGVNDLIAGGLYTQDVTLLSGPPGSYKSVFALNLVRHLQYEHDQGVIWFNTDKRRFAHSHNLRAAIRLRAQILDLFAVDADPTSSAHSALNIVADALQRQKKSTAAHVVDCARHHLVVTPSAQPRRRLRN